MALTRRDFLTMLGAAGVSTVLMPSSTYAEEPYEGQFLLTINALGGWDVTNLCDPKGTVINERYGTGEIGTAGNLTYAPLDTNHDFFQRHHKEMLVVNGIDMAANGHVEAARHAWSGNLADNNTPSIAALFAGAKLRGFDVPAPFVSFGGFSKTGDLVPLTRLNNLGSLGLIGRYERWRGIKTSSTYVDDFAMTEIEAARKARHDRQHAKETLPRYRKERASLFTAQLTAPLLRRYDEFLPEVNNDLNVTESMAAIALASFKAGLGASASIYVSDFDTHSNHEERHAPLLDRLLGAITFALDRAEALQIRDRLTILVGSEFSRTPMYNEGGGKDHWSVGSMLMFGPGIKGNRVIGSTDEGLFAQNVNLDTLQADENGERLRPGHIHKSLRKHLGIDDYGKETGFDLRIRDVPLFT